MSLRFLLPLALLVSASASQASTAVAMEVPELTRRADVVVRARVEGQASHWAPGGRRIVTETRLRVRSTLKGGPARTVTVRQPGGAVGGVAQHVGGAASFLDGEEVLVFLAGSTDAGYRVVGMALGKYRLRQAPDGTGLEAIRDGLAGVRLLAPGTLQPAGEEEAIPLRELQRRVAAALAAPRPGSPR